MAAAVGLALVTAGCSLFGSDDRGQEIDVVTVEVGDCLRAPEKSQAQIVTVRKVDCKEPHEHEVYATEPFAGVDGATPGGYPGDAALTAFAQARCLEEFEGYVGVDYRDSSLFFTWLLPSPRGWEGEGKHRDRSVVCLVTGTGEPRTGSVRQTGL
ncbi:MAG: septum formation family protein [Actinotalea sp.]|nr:septum formation family protein [Actinotalea sp.]